MWDLFVRVVCERDSVWRLKALKTKVFSWVARSKHPTKWCKYRAHEWNAKSQDRMETAGFREYLAGKAFPWDTHETFYFARLSFMIHTFCAYTIYTHITHRCWGVLQRENPSHKPWELEIVIPTIFYIFACGFSSTPTSPFPYHWEVDSPNTYHILSEYPVRFWCCWEALEETRLWRMQLGVLQDSES